jgi:hypothetical protein
MTERERELYDEYERLCHMMQAGVAMEMEKGLREVEPKHLRVGINTSMCDHAALVRLLVAKDILTNEEYAEALRDSMREEVARYEARLTRKMGMPIRLGSLR